MSQSQIITDLSVGRSWVARRGFNNQFTATFTNAGVAYNTSAITYVLNIREIGGSTNLLQLTQGAGITNGGVTGIVSFQLSASNSNLLRAKSYYYEINYTVGVLSYGLLHGTITLVAQYNKETPNNDITVQVNLAGTDLNLDITLAGGGITISTVASTATLTPTTFDAYEITAQAEALTIANPSTDYANFDGFIIRLEDNGTARALTFGNKYRAHGEALPSTTTLGKVMIITALRDSTADKYDVRFSEEV
jgi:hypothetical protein